MCDHPKPWTVGVVNENSGSSWTFRCQRCQVIIEVVGHSYMNREKAAQYAGHAPPAPVKPDRDTP